MANENKPKNADNDILLREATERAEKAERELAALKAAKPASNDTELRAALERAEKAEKAAAAAKEDLADAKERIESAVNRAALQAISEPSTASKKPARCKGRVKFIVGPRGYYNNGNLYPPGSEVILTDDIPGVDFKLAADVEREKRAEAEKALEAGGSTGRAADTTLA